jgi:hypothetical protein
MATPKLTKGEAVKWRRRCGNRVYAAEHALPAKFWERGAQTDLAAIYRACVGEGGPPLVWVRNGTRGRMYGDYSRVVLGTRSPLWLAVHEAAHVKVGAQHGHSQTFVDAYVHLLREHAPPGLTRALIARLRWQDFTIPEVATPHPRLLAAP